MKKFTLYWLSGKLEHVEGNDIADAMNKAGYGGGAVRALDFYSHSHEVEYDWDKEKHSWEMKPEVKEKLFGKQK